MFNRLFTEPLRRFLERLDARVRARNARTARRLGIMPHVVGAQPALMPVRARRNPQLPRR